MSCNTDIQVYTMFSIGENESDTEIESAVNSNESQKGNKMLSRKHLNKGV